MPRVYKPRPGGKRYKKYDEQIIKQALDDLNLNRHATIRSIAEKYDISRSVLQRHSTRQMMSPGGQMALTIEAENYIVQNLNTCAEWGYPLDVIDLRFLVKRYLDRLGITHKRFKNNLPGRDFVFNFLERHKNNISQRLCQNIKRARSSVSPSTINLYFSELEKSIEGVPLSNIINYDETNLSDDPGRHKVLTRRGCKYPERILNHSKASVSIMMAGTAEGELLPPYVVYKSSNLYDTWVKNGPEHARFNRTSSGWFDAEVFQDWVKQMVIPFFEKKQGRKVLLGDNLSSHLSMDLISLCKSHDIHFVFLPANSTHLTQPLDVAFFRPMKIVWRQILQKWKKTDGRSLSSVPKGCFPRMLKLLMDQIQINSANNLRAGFRKTGISPLNPNEVLARLPEETRNDDVKDAIDQSVINLLKEMRYGSINIVEPKNKRKIDVISDSKRDHCNKTVEIYEDVSSPPVTAENFGRPLTCTYRFRAFRGSPKDWILRIRFKKFKVGTLINGTTCHKGYMQIVDGNAKTDVSNRKEPGLFCGEIEQPQTFISETNFVKIVFHADNFTDQTYFSFDSRAEQQFEVYLRYGQHPELYPNRRGEVVTGSYCERVFRDCRLQTCYVQSAAYPGVYPRNLHCRYHLNTRLPYIKLYIENEEFNIDGQRCENIMTCPMRPITSGSENCPYDYIRIYDGKDESASVIGTFCGMGKFPYSIIGTSQDLFVEFVSSPAGPLLNTGFHFNVGNWPGHVEAPGSKIGNCDWLLTAESLKKSGDTEGIFLSVAHWYPPHTSCTYLMQGFPGQVVRLYFPSFRINRIESPISPFTGDCGESLTLYDAPRPDDAKIIKTFCDTFSRPMEKHDFVSTGNAMFVRFESKTGSYSGSSLYYWAHYDFFNNTRFGEPVAGTACDEVIASWKQRAGRLRSPLNTLVYKQAPPGEDVHCLYRFVTDKRIYARVILTILSVNFKEHPYTPVSCQNCYEDRADKLIIWEPFPGGKTTNTSIGITTTPLPLHLAVQRSLGSCLCAKHSNSVSRARPYRVVSSGETLNLQLIVDNAHAAASYFKNPSPLFEARYEFVHGPLCGPPVLAAALEGEIVYPHLEALGYTEPPKRIQCIWDLEIEEKRDIWLHFDSIKFASRHCDDGHIQIYLPGRIEPYLSVCGENVSFARELPPLSAVELGFESLDDPLVMDKDKTRSIRIVFIGSASPARASFKIAWTGLFHLPKNSDGTLMTSRLTEGGSAITDSGHGCDFICPGEEALCIPARLICNGVINCPNVTSGERKFWTAEEKRAREAYSEHSLRRLGYLDAVSGIPLGQFHDEAPELCAGARSAGGGDWLAPALGAGLAIAIGACALAAAWRLCCRKRSPDEESLDY